MNAGLLWLSLAVVGAITLLGIRLLILTGRSGELPELLIGLFFLMVGPLGFLPVFLPEIHPQLRPDHALLARATASTAFTCGLGLMAVFTWLVFRSESRWASWLTLACLLGLFAAYADNALHHDFRGGDPSHLDWHLRVWSRIVVMGWTTLEPFLYWRRLRRRLALGLADPVVANRFLLWTLWAGACFLVFWLGIVQIYVDLGALRHLLRLACGLVALSTMWLTFLPPRAYQRWVRARSAPAGA